MRWDPAEAGDVEDLVRRKRLSLARGRGTRPRRPRRPRAGDRLAVARRRPCARRRHPPSRGAGRTRLAVIAMGKHGAQELNYSSDVDIVLVAADGADADPSLARSVVAIASQAYRIDTNLRPEGRSGVLVRSVDSYVAYWERWARPWEFQALLEGPLLGGRRRHGPALRTGGGRAPLVAAIRRRRPGRAADDEGPGGGDRRQPGPRPAVSSSGAAAASATWSSPCSSCNSSTAAAIPALRLRATLPCLAELADAGYVAAEDAAALAIAYRFLRTVEHRLQLVEEAQVHTVPSDRESRDRLARVLGFRGQPEETPATASTPSSPTIKAHGTGDPRAPVLQAPARGLRRAQPAGLRAGRRLRHRFARRRRGTARRLRLRRRRPDPPGPDELTRGLTRSSRLMQQLLPLLLDWLSESPDPDQGLVGLRTLAGGPHRRDLLVTAFRESPELARRLCLLLGTSRRLGEIIARHPDFVDPPRRQVRPCRARNLASSSKRR